MSATPSPEPEAGELRIDENYDEPPANTGESPPFKFLSQLFEKLANERKYDKKRKLLESWFKRYREDVGYNLYDVLRLLLPQKDRERAVYQVKEKNLGKLFIRAIPLGKNDPDAVRLLNWKRPSDENKATGDFPAVLFDVVSKRSSVTNTTMTIAQVNETLDSLAKAGGKMDNQQPCIQLIYNKCTPADQRWIVRIILKDLHISAKETSVFQVFHPDAQALFNTCSDLKRVAYQLWDRSYSLHADAKTVQLFHAFTPMLCKRPLQSIELTVKKMGGQEFYIEEKLDGERMQLHKRGNEYFYCSRKGKEYTHLYGRHVGEGSLTPHIHKKAFHEAAEDLILDGEMLVYDPVTERYLPFGNLKTAALDKSKKVSRPRPCFKVFDILMINGKSLLHKSTDARKKNLIRTVREVPGRLELAVGWKGTTAKDVRQRMEEVMDNRGEGLVIKHPLAQYVLNGRNEDWIKVKPEYMDNMGETVDVLVTGGQFGGGKRGGGVSSLICSVRDDSNGDDDDDDFEPKYRTFVRIGSGLSYTDYQMVRAKPWKPFDVKNPPSWLSAAPKGLEDKGDVYLDPEDSFILKVKAAEITPSDQYHMGFTMRFPRAIAIRDDLGIDDCVTASEIMADIKKEKKRKMEATAAVANKKRKTTAKKQTIATFSHQQLPEGIAEVEPETTMLSGMKFHVLLEGKPTKVKDAETKKHNLETLIVRQGGEFTAGHKGDPATILLYGGESKPAAVAMLIRAGNKDIVRTKWITDSVRKGRVLPLTKKYLFFATDETMQTEAYEAPDTESEDEPEAHARPNVEDDAMTLATSRDEDFDVVQASSSTVQPEQSDTETDPESVQGDDDEYDTHSLLFGGSWEEVPASDQEAENEDQDEPMQYDDEKLFRHLHFYLDTLENARANGLKIKGDAQSSPILEASREKIEEGGGSIVGLDDPLLSHIIFDPDDTVRRLEIKRRLPKDKERYFIIADWVDACIEGGTLVDERMFDA